MVAPVGFEPIFFALKEQGINQLFDGAIIKFTESVILLRNKNSGFE